VKEGVVVSNRRPLV